MTLQRPRIYTYKITFEEVPYYYYGVHKEKRFDEHYMGSPKTHKWAWEFYTPKKQILELFDYSDDGWLKAQEIEKQLIRSFFNTDKWCLNMSCGGIRSLDILRNNGKNAYEEKKGMFSISSEERSQMAKEQFEQMKREKRGLFSLTPEQKSQQCREVAKRSYEEGKGIASLTTEQRQEIGRRNGKKLYEERNGMFSLTTDEKEEISRKAGNLTYELGLGVHGLSEQEKRENGRKGGKIAYEKGIGIHALTHEERSENSRKVGKKVGKQVWQCTVTGYVSGVGGLNSYQRKRNIDLKNRIRIK